MIFLHPIWKTINTVPLHNTDFNNHDEDDSYIIHSITLLRNSNITGIKDDQGNNQVKNCSYIIVAGKTGKTKTPANPHPLYCRTNSSFT